MKKITREDLKKIKEATAKKDKNWVKVGMSTCGIAAGADEVYRAFLEEVKKRNIDIQVKQCGCAGMCYGEPLVEVNVEGTPRVFYGKVNKDLVSKIIEKHIVGKMLVNDQIYNIPVHEKSVQANP